MKKIFLYVTIIPALFTACDKRQEPEAVLPDKLKTEKKLFLDVHALGAGKVTAADVAEAHKKDLAVQNKYDVDFIKYWVDEQGGKVYCLAEASDGYLVHKTHKEAHGLLPDDLMQVTDGPEA